MKPGMWAMLRALVVDVLTVRPRMAAQIDSQRPSPFGDNIRGQMGMLPFTDRPSRPLPQER